jgi:hypothetical protein
VPRNTQVTRILLVLRRLGTLRRATLEALAHAPPADSPGNLRAVRRGVAAEARGAGLVFPRESARSLTAVPLLGASITCRAAHGSAAWQGRPGCRDPVIPSMRGAPAHAGRPRLPGPAAIRRKLPEPDRVRRQGNTSSDGRPEPSGACASCRRRAPPSPRARASIADKLGILPMPPRVLQGNRLDDCFKCRTIKRTNEEHQLWSVPDWARSQVALSRREHEGPNASITDQQSLRRTA